MAKPEDMACIEEIYSEYNGENMKGLATYDKWVVAESIKAMIDQQAFMIATVSGEPFGVIAGYFIPCNFSKDIMFMCMFFYVKQKYRNLSEGLLKAIEALLVSTPATKFVMSSPGFDDSEKYDRFYQMNGFRLLEKHFVKNVTK